VQILLANASYAELFHTPDSLKVQVNFWEKIYSYYDSNQVIYYNDQDPDIIYYVLDLPKVANELSAPRFKADVQAKLKEIREILSGSKSDALASEMGRKINELLKKHKLVPSETLASQLRCQSGLRSQFALGLKASGRYSDEMKRLFAAQDLPTDLVSLVFVESLFYMPAESFAGAKGPWGLMKETAIRSGIYVNRRVDERVDPLLASVAAANYLKKAKEGLGDWAAAITAYNYGYSGMLRAKANLGTADIEAIIAKHQSPIFGYAAKNYYAEFLAALRIYNNHEKYFPEVKKDLPWTYDVVEILRPILVRDLYAVGAVSPSDLKAYNPGLILSANPAHDVIPANFSMRVPKGKADHFYAMLRKVPQNSRSEAANKVIFTYDARGKEPITLIAQKNGFNPLSLAQRIKQTVSYKPKGRINVRPSDLVFSKLADVAKAIFASVNPSEIAKK
jgi:membrane-bound lytic murein transglycosylase D